jgi:hypothetical protein
MTAKQAHGIQNKVLGRMVPPEIVIVGHQRPRNPNASDVDVNFTEEAMTTGSNTLADLFENRYDSLSRLVAGQVTFHSMMWRISTLNLPEEWRWLYPWNWKIFRTQSGTAIATTASPESGTQEESAGEQTDEWSVAASSLSAVDGTESPVRPGGMDMTSSALNAVYRESGYNCGIAGTVVDARRIADDLPDGAFRPVIVRVEPLGSMDVFLQ